MVQMTQCAVEPAWFPIRKHPVLGVTLSKPRLVAELRSLGCKVDLAALNPGTAPGMRM
jgi:hypothetical protein